MLLAGFFLLSPSAFLVPSAFASKIYVSNEKGNTVTVIDSETWDQITEFPAGNRPRGIGISPDGKHQSGRQASLCMRVR